MDGEGRKTGGVKIEEWLAVGLFFVSFAIHIFFFGGVSISETAMRMLKYFSLGTPFLFIFSFALYIYLFFKAFYGFVNTALDIVIERKGNFNRSVFRKLCGELVRPFRVIAPIALISVSLYGLLGSLGTALQGRAQDTLLYYADEALLGVNPFLWLPQVFSHDVLVGVLSIAYGYLSIYMGITLLIFFFRAEKLFRLTILSFIVILAIAFPIYFVMPCQDPSNEFIYNIRATVHPPDISEKLASFEPSPKTEKVTLMYHDSEYNKKDGTVPISCFPSMHAAWSFTLLFLLARWSLLSLVVSVPFTILTLTGGLYFAQHYFIDYVIAIPVVVVSLVVAELLYRFDEKRKGEKQ